MSESRDTFCMMEIEYCRKRLDWGDSISKSKKCWRSEEIRLTTLYWMKDYSTCCFDKFSRADKSSRISKIWMARLRLSCYWESWRSKARVVKMPVSEIWSNASVRQSSYFVFNCWDICPTILATSSVSFIWASVKDVKSSKREFTSYDGSALAKFIIRFFFKISRFFFDRREIANSSLFWNRL